VQTQKTEKQRGEKKEDESKDDKEERDFGDNESKRKGKIERRNREKKPSLRVNMSEVFLQHLRTTFPLVPPDSYDEWITINFPASEDREYILEKMRRKDERVFRVKTEEADSGLKFYFYFENTQTHVPTGSRSFEVRREVTSSLVDTFESTSPAAPLLSAH